MNISFEGVAQRVVTLAVDTTGTTQVEAGDLAALSASGTVKPCPVSTAPVGLVLGVRDGLAAVQVSGYMRVPCASALGVGCAALALDSTGKLDEADAGGRPGIVVDVDTAAGVCGVIFC